MVNFYIDMFNDFIIITLINYVSTIQHDFYMRFIIFWAVNTYKLKIHLNEFLKVMNQCNDYLFSTSISPNDWVIDTIIKNTSFSIEVFLEPRLASIDVYIIE